MPKEITLHTLIDEVYASEGGNRSDMGYVENDGPNAKGEYHPSKAGVLQPTFDWFCRVKQKQTKPVKELTKDEIYEFYHWWIGERSGAVDVPSWFSYALGDWYVQSGGHAIKPLQELAGVTVDGAWGPNTASAVNAYIKENIEDKLADDPHADNEFINWYIEQRREFIRSLKRSDEKGIMARIDKVLRISLEQVEANDTLSVPKTFDLEEEMQSHAIMETTTQPPADAPVTRGEFDELKDMVTNVLETLQNLTADKVQERKKGFLK